MKTTSDNWDRDERESLSLIEDELTAVRARHADDPPLDLLRAARAGVLPPDVQELADEHLSKSAWSRTLVAGAEDANASLGDDDIDRLMVRLRTDIRKDAAPESRAGLFRGWQSLLATAAVLATVIVVAAVTIRRSRPAEPPASTEPEATVAVNRPPAFQLPLEKPEVKLSVAALTWRGSAGANQLLDDLAPAIDAFRRSDYRSAVRLLEPLEQRYPAAPEAPFYRGVSRLFLNDPNGAIDDLQKAGRAVDATFAVDAAWYLAVAEQRAGRLAEARVRLDGLCRTTNARTSSACDAIKQLDAAARPQ